MGKSPNYLISLPNLKTRTGTFFTLEALSEEGDEEGFKILVVISN